MGLMAISSSNSIHYNLSMLSKYCRIYSRSQKESELKLLRRNALKFIFKISCVIGEPKNVGKSVYKESRCINNHTMTVHPLHFSVYAGLAKYFHLFNAFHHINSSFYWRITSSSSFRLHLETPINHIFVDHLMSEILAHPAFDGIYLLFYLHCCKSFLIHFKSRSWMLFQVYLNHFSWYTFYPICCNRFMWDT